VLWLWWWTVWLQERFITWLGNLLQEAFRTPGRRERVEPNITFSSQLQTNFKKRPRHPVEK